MEGGSRGGRERGRSALIPFAAASSTESLATPFSTVSAMLCTQAVFDVGELM